MESSGGGDGLGPSTAPLAWHDFLERMRHPSAADLVKSIKSFVVSFSNKAPDSEKDSAAVQEFLASMESSFRSHSLWAGSTEEELESAGEGLEKYVMTKLYNRAFASLPDDVKRDEELFEKISLVQKFIRPENLDIKPKFQNETAWLLAQKELQKINMYKAPRDKLVCILNCCKVINNLLLNASISSNDNPPGADEFLPVLIYVTIKANPPQLHSNLLYIQQYRRQSRLVSEAAYYFTNILSAESFIWNIDAQSLSMDETEYQYNMEIAKALVLGLTSDSQSQETQINEEEGTEINRDINSLVKEQNIAQQTHDFSKDQKSMDQRVTSRPSISDMEKHGATDLFKDDQSGRYFLDYPFLYAHAGELTAEDVESLLGSYKQLVLRYVSLCRGMGIPSLPLSASTIQGEALTESTVESREPAEVVAESGNYQGLTSSIIDDNHEGLKNRSNESSQSLTKVKQEERREGLTNNQSSDSLFSGMDDSEPKVLAEESASQSLAVKSEIFE